MKRLSIALLSAGILVVAIGVIVVVRGLGIKQSNEEILREDAAAVAAGNQEREQLDLATLPPTTYEAVASTEAPPTTEPATTVPRRITATTTATTTTTLPPTTTTVPLPVVPDRSTIAVNAIFGELDSPELGMDLNLSRANEMDDGYQALLAGPAWFPSSLADKDLGIASNDLQMACGSNGNIAIGAHRGGTRRDGFFAKLDQLRVDNEVTITTPWGVCVYRVTIPCHEPAEAQAHCTLPELGILPAFANYQSPTGKETLFLFSCDDGMRIYVTLELYSINGVIV